MVKISSKDELEDWLEGKPRQFAACIAARAGLRVLPMLVRVFAAKIEAPDRDIVMPCFRAAASSVAGVAAPSDAVARAAFDAADAAYAAADAAARAAYAAAVDDAAVDDAAAYAARAAYAAAAAAAYAARAAYAAAAYAADAAAYAAAAATWDAVSADCTALEREPLKDVIARRLWPKHGEPDWSRGHWDRMRAELGNRPEAEGWQVWLDWWEDRRDGINLCPEMQAEIATLPNDLWKGEIAPLNAKIAEIRGRYVKVIPEVEDVARQKRTSLRIAPRDGRLGLLVEPTGAHADSDQALMHAALIDDCVRLRAALDSYAAPEGLEAGYIRLRNDTERMIVALGQEYSDLKPVPLWLAARTLREIERIDRRKDEAFGKNEPRLASEIGEVLATTVTTFSGLCLVEPELQGFERQRPEALEALKIDAEALEPILNLLREHRDKFFEELREAFDGLLADARSDIERVAQRGQLMTVEGVENIVKALIVEAIKEWRTSEPSPFWDAYKKKAGEHAADLTVGTLSFSAKMFVAYLFMDHSGIIAKLPDAAQYRDVLERIVQNATKGGG